MRSDKIFKLRRFLAFLIDTILGMMISNYIGLGILTLLKMINTPLVIVGIVSTLIYFLFLYIFIVNKNYLIFQGQSLGQKIFKLQLNYNGIGAANDLEYWWTNRGVIGSYKWDIEFSITKETIY